MDTDTSIEKLKQSVKSFCDERDWEKYHNAKDLAIGIVTEAAELIEHFRFKSLEEVEQLMDNNEKKTEISNELSDALFFILRFAVKYDIDLSNEFYRKLEINKQKYPVEKCKGLNLKYNDYYK
mgnify:CR=1 FL=1